MPAPKRFWEKPEDSPKSLLEFKEEEWTHHTDVANTVRIINQGLISESFSKRINQPIKLARYSYSEQKYVNVGTTRYYTSDVYSTPDSAWFIITPKRLGVSQSGTRVVERRIPPHEIKAIILHELTDSDAKRLIIAAAAIKGIPVYEKAQTSERKVISSKRLWPPVKK